MRVLLTGAYGLIGAACLARLHEAGHDLIAAGRSIGSARRRFPYARWIEADFAKLTSPELWLPLLAGVDAVVNCVGALQDSARDDVDRVQRDGTVALFEACMRAGVKRIVHISAIGAELEGPSAFARTKAQAEVHLKTLALDWVILRPGLVLAPAVYGGSAVLRAIAAFPGFLPVVAADAHIQVIGIDDLSAAVASALTPNAPSKVVWDVAHPQVHTLAAIVMAMRQWLGIALRRVVPIPDGVAKVVAVCADGLGWLGWRSPVRTTSLLQLKAGVVGDPGPWIAATGAQPRSLDQILAARPSNVQDRWFARLYLIKPIAVASLAASAISIGAWEFTSACKLAAALSGIPRAALLENVLPGLIAGAIEFALGIALLLHRTAHLVLLILLAMTLLAAITNSVAELSAMHYPITFFGFGVPGLLALLFTLAILDER
jgi:uncharacterized protein YbjT (DUF2867 family)